MSESCELNQKEIRTRKWWLWSSVFYFVVFPVISLSSSFYIFKANICSIVLYMLLIPVVISLIQFGLLWFFTYKKYGLILLIFWLILSPIQFLSSIINIAKPPYDVLAYLITAFSIPFYLVWYFFSIRLVKINRICRLQKHINPDFLDSLGILRTATSVEELDRQVGELVKKWPKFEPFSYREYKIRKLELLKKGN